MTRVNRLLSSLAALGILGLMVYAVYSIAILPLTDRLTAAEEGIDQQRRLLGHLIAEARTTTTAGTAQPADLSAGDFIDGESEATRIARLQSRLAVLAAAAGLKVGSSRAMAERSEGLLRLSGIEAQVTGNVDQIQSLLHALESGSPALVVETLEIIRSPSPAGRSSGDLEARVVVTGAVPPKQG